MRKLGLFLLFVVCLGLTGCGEDKFKVVTSIDNFVKVVSDKNFLVEDNIDDYKNVGYIVQSRKATFNDIEIDMILYSDNDSAEKVLKSHIENFNLLKNTGAYEENYSGDNYHRYALVSNNKYMISVRVENTLIFCKTNLINKEKVDVIYDTLGY